MATVLMGGGQYNLHAAELPSAFPSRPITLIVPWPAGGATDITMRILADLAARQLGKPIVVENRPGAAGTLVGPALRAALADGYTYRFAREPIAIKALFLPFFRGQRARSLARQVDAAA